MAEVHFEGETTLTNSSSEGSCGNKTNMTMKPCYVVLKNVDCELKGSHKCCLMSPKTKGLPRKIRKAKKSVSFEKLKAGLCDMLARHSIQIQRNLPNPTSLPESKKVDSGLQLNNSEKVVSKETNTDHDINKAERENSFPGSFTLCDIFANIEPNVENSSAGCCHVQEIGKGAQSLWEDSVLIPDTQNPVSFEPTVKCMEPGENTKQTERKESSHEIDMPVSKYLLETSTGSTSPSSRIDRHISPGETLPISKTSSASSSVLPLDRETEPYLASSLPGNALKLDLKDGFPRKNMIKIPERRRIQDSIQLSAEIGILEQTTVEELDALKKTRPMPRKENNNSFWFKFQKGEVINAGDPRNTTYEENMSQKMQNGGHSSGISPSGSQPFPGDVTNIKHSEVRKETVINGRENSNAEERGNSQPAKESLVGKEDPLLLRQPHGVQTVFYELSGSTVKLLGTPRDNSEMLVLDRLIELDTAEFLQYQECQGHSPSLNEENDGSSYSTEVTWCQPFYSDDTRPVTQKGIQRPKRSLALIPSSKLSEEESRIKVVDSLREVLQKRLDDSPDLNMEEDDVLRIAKKVEKALFNLSCCVDQHYKNKYRSLLFNLKSAKNQHLFYKVILGMISPKRLVQMNALELAPEDLAEWRARERKHALEVIEKEEREAPRCCLTKFTHKGIIEIHRETDEDLMFQEIFGSQLVEDENSHPKTATASVRYSGDNHKSHTSDLDCLHNAGQMAADSEGGFKPPTHKHILKQETNVSKCLQSNTVYSGGGERRLQEDSSVSASFPKKLRVRNQSGTSIIWRGVIQMFSLKPFAAKAYPVSGFSYHLFQAVPDLLQSRGFILPEDVWAHLDRVWPANTKVPLSKGIIFFRLCYSYTLKPFLKEIALIKFHPSSTKGCSPYSMLYSYLNDKQRYGIVDSDQMEMFMVPLAAYQPVPSKLHPLGGPGLNPCHPSLLLGLILPKRPPTTPHPLPKTRRKSVTFKDDIEIQYFPVLSQADTHPMQPPQPLSLIEPLWGCNCPVAVIPEHKPLLSEELGSKVVHGGLCSLPQETAGGGTGQSLSDIILQLQCDSPCLEGQLGSLMLETLRAQSQQAGICTDHDPQCTGNSLGLLPSETVFPNQCEVDGGHGANVLDTSLLLCMLCPESVPPAKASEAPSLLQIPGAPPIAADSNSLMEEALSLIQYVTQLQPRTTPNQEPAMSLETTPVLSQAVTGAEFPVVFQNDDNGYAHIQLFLSSLGGQTQSPAT